MHPHVRLEFFNFEARLRFFRDCDRLRSNAMVLDPVLAPELTPATEAPCGLPLPEQQVVEVEVPA